MKKLRYGIVVLLTLLISSVIVPVAFAHPLGNFTINQYVGLDVSREKVLLDYVLDMAEIPAFQEISAFDANGNGQADPSEAEGYHADKCASLRADLKLSLNNRPVDFTRGTSSVEFPVGVGGLPTLRLTCEFEAALALTDGNPVLSFANQAFPDRLGWKEIVVFADGISLQGDYSTTSSSNRLTNYPANLLTSPLDQRQVEFEVTSAALPKQNESSGLAESTSPLADRNDAFTRLILMEDITLPALLLALVISLVWGAMHALTPGHGKTIVGAYLVGSRGTLKHALYLGLTTTITHTLGVFALGLITLFAAQFIVPEQLYPWMSLLSGLFVVGIGINLFVNRFRSSLHKFAPSLRRLSQNTAVAGSLPAKMVVEEIGSHERGYVLNTSHGHFHSPAAHSHSHADHDHDHGHSHDHSHDNADHAHLPPGADGSPITWHSLLALGVSGGLLPCPSALVVLLGAIALNKIGFGLILVFAFSLGLAGALTAIGMMFIYAGRLFARFPSQGRLITLLPAFSALFISVIGVAISIKALAQIGIV
jgi:ABC-type nickel/cobalt efflux system permease component RcnA